MCGSPSPREKHELERADTECLLAVPKKGRLAEFVLQLLAGAGVKFGNRGRSDCVRCVNMPLTLYFLRASDIARFVGDGRIDMGITGEVCSVGMQCFFLC